MERASVDISADASLENILTEIGGFGLFHIISYLLVFIPNVIQSATYVNFMFAASSLEYRCKVPECEFGKNNREIPYDSPWAHYAIPSLNGKIDRCFRYAPKNLTIIEGSQCNADMFDNSTKIECTEFIFATGERTIQTEFSIHCSDSYKLALVGTINSFARFIFLPIAGYLSDRYGRLTMAVIGIVASSVVGVIKSFSVTYLMYIVLEFFEAGLNTCLYGSLFVLAIELVGSRHRVLTSTLLPLSFPFGQIIFGIIVMYVDDFRVFTRLFYVPGLFLFVYYWLLPESFRWLLVTGRVEHAIKVLKRIARWNGKELSAKSIEMLKLKYATELLLKNIPAEIEKKSDSSTLFQSFCMVFKSKTLCLRFFSGCFQWITCCFCYYGVSLSTISIPGANRYVSFILGVTAEIPAIVGSLPLVYRVKRRTFLFATFFVTAISVVATAFVPENRPTIVMILYMIGKASLTAAFVLMYTFTAEQWPTNLRTTMLNTGSMIGRTGSMVAPLVVVLGAEYGSLPALLFGGSAIIAAFLVVFNPETFGKKLPDTIQEAKCL